MAYRCILHPGAECDGCGECEQNEILDEELDRESELLNEEDEELVED